MSHEDHASERNSRIITEAQRTQEFKKLRTSLLDSIRSLHTGLSEGHAKDGIDYWVSSELRGGGTRITMPITLEAGKGERAVIFREEAYRYFEEGEAYGPTDSEAVIAWFDERIKDDATHEFERIGWSVQGDGSVHRLFYEKPATGDLVPAERATDDSADLQMANSYLAQVLVDSVN